MCLLLFCEKEIIQPKNSFLMKHFWSIFNKTKYFSNINPRYTGEEPGHEALLHAVHTTHTSSWHLRSSKWPAPRRAKWSLTFTWLYLLKSIRTKCKLINVVGYGCTKYHDARVEASVLFSEKGSPCHKLLHNERGNSVCVHSLFTTGAQGAGALPNPALRGFQGLKLRSSHLHSKCFTHEYHIG